MVKQVSHFDILARTIGAEIVDSMIGLMAMDAAMRVKVDARKEITTVDGHSWRVKLEYLGYEEPRGLAAELRDTRLA